MAELSDLGKQYTSFSRGGSLFRAATRRISAVLNRSVDRLKNLKPLGVLVLAATLFATSCSAAVSSPDPTIGEATRQTRPGTTVVEEAPSTTQDPSSDDSQELSTEDFPGADLEKCQIRVSFGEVFGPPGSEGFGAQVEAAFEEFNGLEHGPEVFWSDEEHSTIHLSFFSFGDDAGYAYYDVGPNWISVVLNADPLDELNTADQQKYMRFAAFQALSFAAFAGQIEGSVVMGPDVSRYHEVNLAGGNLVPGGPEDLLAEALYSEDLTGIDMCGEAFNAASPSPTTSSTIPPVVAADSSTVQIKSLDATTDVRGVRTA